MSDHTPSIPQKATPKLSKAQLAALEDIANHKVYHSAHRFSGDAYVIAGVTIQTSRTLRGATAQKLIELGLVSLRRNQSWVYLKLTDAGRRALAAHAVEPERGE